MNSYRKRLSFLACKNFIMYIWPLPKYLLSNILQELSEISFLDGS